MFMVSILSDIKIFKKRRLWTTELCISGTRRVSAAKASERVAPDFQKKQRYLV